MDLHELKTLQFWIAVFAEFQATMLFILIATGSAMSLNEPSYVHVALCFGFSVATLVQAVGHISGGHLNPAVTIAMMVTGRVGLFRGIFYVLAQMLGAICASAILKGLTPVPGQLAVNKMMNDVTPGQGFGVELFITWQFIWTVFATTDPDRKDQMGSPALAIGISIVIGHLFAIGYTNCGLNPARSFGPAVVSGFWVDHWVFWLGPITGAIIAAIQYDFFLAPTASRAKFRRWITCQGDAPMQIDNPIHMVVNKEEATTTVTA